MTDGSAATPIRPGTLYLLRHAHAGDPAAWSGPDEVRPLSAKGRRQAKRLGRFLCGGPFRPGLILTSPKVRAEQTAQAVAKELDLKVHVDERLASGFGLRSLNDLLSSIDDREIMLVGHDPDFSALLSILIGARGMVMKKGALAVVDLVTPVVHGCGTLRFLVSPELFDKP